MAQQTTPCLFRAVPPPLNLRIVTVRTLLSIKKIHGCRDVKAGLLPDSQASPNETISERPSEEAYGTDDFGVQTIHGVPMQLWCTTRHQGAYTKFEVDEHPDWGTGKPDSHWDYGDLELMSK
jgi:hypothetical protein